MRRSWLLEGSLGALALAVGAVFLAGTLSDGGGAPLPVELAAGAAATAALIRFRRSRPVALTLVLIPAGIVFGLPMGATPVALFAVGLHRRPLVAGALTALHAGCVAGAYYLVLGPTRVYVEAVGFVVLLHAGLAGVAALIRSHRLLVRSWVDRARQAEQGRWLRVEQARLGERERIAREMHDVLAHRISLLAVHAGALEVRRDAPETERRSAGVIRQGAYEALEDLRRVILTLREPGADRPQPTLADLPALVERSVAAGTPVRLAVTAADDVPAGVGRHAYRIVEEALADAGRHPPGAPVTVAVTGSAGDGLLVEVGNAVVAGDAGLVRLRERVRLAGGRLEHGPTATGGFRVRAWLPCRA